MSKLLKNTAYTNSKPDCASSLWWLEAELRSLSN